MIKETTGYISHAKFDTFTTGTTLEASGKCFMTPTQCQTRASGVGKWEEDGEYDREWVEGSSKSYFNQRLAGNRQGRRTHCCGKGEANSPSLQGRGNLKSSRRNERNCSLQREEVKSGEGKKTIGNTDHA